MTRLVAISATIALGLLGTAQASEPVTVDNFVRAETDMTFKFYAGAGAFGEFLHIREPAPLDEQRVIRMNRDTLYSSLIVDLDAGPVTIVKPDGDGRFQSMLVINQDHSMLPVEHGAGEFTFTRDEIGTRYALFLFRTFADANSADDIRAANALQDRLGFRQESVGRFEVPDWDEESLVTLRRAINVLAATKPSAAGMFGNKDELNPIDHLLGTASGWGGNPIEAAVYLNRVPDKNDGETPHAITVTEAVPVDGFVSITVYDKDGYMAPNELGINSINNVTAERNADGTVTVHFGDCEDGRVNCIPITVGWNYVVRLYQPRPEIISGAWKSPEARSLD